MAQLYHTTPKEWQTILNKYMSEVLTCEACGKEYLEIDTLYQHNIGRWACSQHPGSLDPTSNRWTCCNRHRHWRANGCVRADHRRIGIPYSEMHDLVIPIRFHGQIIELFQESVINIHDFRQARVFMQYTDVREQMTSVFGGKAFDERNDVIVRRYDWKQQDSIVETGQSIYENDGIGNSRVSIKDLLE